MAAHDALGVRGCGEEVSRCCVAGGASPLEHGTSGHAGTNADVGPLQGNGVEIHAAFCCAHRQRRRTVRDRGSTLPAWYTAVCRCLMWPAGDTCGCVCQPLHAAHHQKVGATALYLVSQVYYHHRLYAAAMEAAKLALAWMPAHSRKLANVYTVLGASCSALVRAGSRCARIGDCKHGPTHPQSRGGPG